MRERGRRARERERGREGEREGGRARKKERERDIERERERERVRQFPAASLQPCQELQKGINSKVVKTFAWKMAQVKARIWP